MLEIGATYITRATPTSPRERKGRLIRDLGYVVELRWPNGLTGLVAADELAGPVEPDPPPDPCPLCLGSREVARRVPTETQGVEKIVGAEPCPMCQRGV